MIKRQAMVFCVRDKDENDDDGGMRLFPVFEMKYRQRMRSQLSAGMASMMMQGIGQWRG